MPKKCRIYLLLFLCQSIGAMAFAENYLVMVSSNDTVYFDLGFEDGIRKNMRLAVMRNDESELLKIAEIDVQETFPKVSKGKLISKFIGVNLKINDLVEVIPIEKELHGNSVSIGTQEPVEDQQRSSSQKRWKFPSLKFMAGWGKWIALSSGTVAGFLANQHYKLKNEAIQKHNANFAEFGSDDSRTKSAKKNAEKENKKFITFTATSIVLIGYSGYEIILSPSISKDQASMRITYIF